MATMVRIQFAKMPSPSVLGQILALAAMDPNYEDADVLEDGGE